MSEFTWDPRLATGIVSIDTQHIELFKAAEALHAACGAGNAEETLPRVLDQLVTYCRTHFDDEEAHMERVDFPGLQSQREEHQNLLAQVYRMLGLHTIGDPQVSLDLSILITQWLRRHIKERDQSFADFLRKSEQAESAD